MRLVKSHNSRESSSRNSGPRRNGSRPPRPRTKAPPRVSRPRGSLSPALPETNKEPSAVETELIETSAADSTAVSMLELYLREIGRVKLLTPQEELALGARVQQGDEEAREHMIRANLRLVVKIAREYENLGLPLLDLINEGNMGLMKGVERFDPTRGAKLSTYASWWIKQSIKRALANQSKTIRLPVHVVDKVSHIRRAELKLKDLFGREPSDEEVAEEVGIRPEQVRDYRNAAKSTVSLDAPVGSDDESQRVSEVVADDRAEAPFENIARGTDQALMREAFATLKSREQEVLSLRFGLLDDTPMTLEQIGQRFGLTRERIRQIENEALKKLKLRMSKRDSLAAESIMALAE